MTTTKGQLKWARYLANKWLGKCGHYRREGTSKIRSYDKGGQLLQWSESNGQARVLSCPKDPSVKPILAALGLSNSAIYARLRAKAKSRAKAQPQEKPQALSLREKRDLCVARRLAAECGFSLGTPLQQILSEGGAEATAKYLAILRSVPSYVFSESQLMQALPQEYLALRATWGT